MNSSNDKTDTDIKNDILSELRFEPSVKVTDIGVIVRDGVVTLTGSATNYGEKWNAVRAAKRIGGVRAIADCITVKLTDSLIRTDGEIAAAAVNQLTWSSSIPADNYKVMVREGWITLEGIVEWRYEKDAAESAVRHLIGVKGVTNMITILPKKAPINIESEIKSAIGRSSLLFAAEIAIAVAGNDVTLTGTVRNYAELEETERIAWAAPGVDSVRNQLKVEWSLDFAESD